MKELYEVPEIHEMGAAEVVVQGAKDPESGDGSIGPNRLTVSAITEED